MEKSYSINSVKPPSPDVIAKAWAAVWNHRISNSEDPSETYEQLCNELYYPMNGENKNILNQK